MTVYRSKGLERVEEDMAQFPDSIESALGQARINYKLHDPEHYSPALVPGVRPYCHTCGRRVAKDGCRPYLDARAALQAAGRRL